MTGHLHVPGQTSASDVSDQFHNGSDLHPRPKRPPHLTVCCEVTFGVFLSSCRVFPLRLLFPQLPVFYEAGSHLPPAVCHTQILYQSWCDRGVAGTIRQELLFLSAGFVVVLKILPCCLFYFTLFFYTFVVPLTEPWLLLLSSLHYLCPLETHAVSGSFLQHRKFSFHHYFSFLLCDHGL